MNDVIRARAFAPGWARLVDAWRVAGQAVEVLARGRIVVGEAGRVRKFDVLGLAALADVELGEGGCHGRRDERGRRGDGRMVRPVLESGKARLEELRVEVGGR